MRSDNKVRELATVSQIASIILMSPWDMWRCWQKPNCCYLRAAVDSRGDCRMLSLIGQETCSVYRTLIWRRFSGNHVSFRNLWSAVISAFSRQWGNELCWLMYAWNVNWVLTTTLFWKFLEVVLLTASSPGALLGFWRFRLYHIFW
jgi:hypothetical protein